jgi:hypothetical protein
MAMISRLMPASEALGTQHRVHQVGEGRDAQEQGEDGHPARSLHPVAQPDEGVHRPECQHAQEHHAEDQHQNFTPVAPRSTTAAASAAAALDPASPPAPVLFIPSLPTKRVRPRRRSQSYDSAR